jgi:hypothetical protein
MRSLIRLHQLCRAVVQGHEVTNVRELEPVLMYWQRVRGENHE